MFKDIHVNRHTLISLIKPLFSLLALFALVLYLSSCQKDPVREKPKDPPTPPDTNISYESGIFVMNEGNFNWGNASVTFISNDYSITEQDIFGRINGRSIGDVVQSMKIVGDFGFIVVNNTNNIEVVNLRDFTSYKTIKGFDYPRYLEVVDDNRAYVTNLRKDISVVDLNSMTVVKSIRTPYWTERLIRYGNQMFVTCYGGFTDPSIARKSQIYVIDTKEDKIVDSIITGKEPTGIVLDFKEKMWILCSGGFDNFEAPTLLRVDPVARIIEKTFTFPSTGILPSRLCINPSGDTLYFLNNGVFQMPVNSSALPETSFIPPEGRLLYGLEIHPGTGEIYVTDAVDYVQDGVVFRYSQRTGQLLGRYDAGRIPAYICFTPQQ